MNPSSSGSILVVDDEMPLMIALRNTLRDEGYDVTGVSSGAEALAALRAGTFELVLTDLMMPEMDGITLLREALVIDPTLAGIIMTGHGTIPTAVEAMKTGATDYVLKPFKLSALLPALERALTIRRLRVKNAELERRVHARTSELEAANNELEAFSYSVSHDLNTPLRAITGLTDILLKRDSQAVPPETRRYLQLIHDGTVEMSRLISDLLAFSHLGRKAIARQPVDPAQICRDVFADLEGDRTGRKVELRIRDVPKTSGDPALIRQVLVNLLSNAIKFTRPRDPAVIELGVMPHTSEGGAVYFVRDNGVGFDMRHAEKLFGVFQRLHNSREFEGTGVGLATVQRIIERHGGRIWAESSPNAGATFFFTLPPTAA